MRDGDTGRTFVVPAQTSVEILSNSDVVPGDVARAAENVDESATDALHEGARRAAFRPAFARLRRASARSRHARHIPSAEQLDAERVSVVRLRSLRELRRDSL